MFFFSGVTITDVIAEVQSCENSKEKLSFHRCL